MGCDVSSDRTLPRPECGLQCHASKGEADFGSQGSLPALSLNSVQDTSSHTAQPHSMVGIGQQADLLQDAPMWTKVTYS